MATCTLQIDGRGVLVSSGGPPDAEYALFDAGEIQLQTTEPGVVREIAYRTTVQKARERLEERGLSLRVAEEIGETLQPKLATTYARGAVARGVVRHLGALELLDAVTFDAKARAYAGALLDLPGLAADLGLRGAANALQATSLYLRLLEIGTDAPVYLSTSDHTTGKRPGTRTHKRPSLDALGDLADALRRLATRAPNIPASREAGPSRVELGDQLRARLAWATLASTRERIEAALHALQKRERPAKGPLSSPDIWELEEKLTGDDTEGVAEKLDRLEASGGRTPATTYLRARLALLTGHEDALLVAERVSALALSMTSFTELQLLAAQAWTAAGDQKRAAPFAKNLADDPHASDDLRTKAREILALPAGAFKARRSTAGQPRVAPATEIDARPSARPSARPPAPRPTARPDPPRPASRPPPRPTGRPAEARSSTKRPSGMRPPEKGLPFTADDEPSIPIDPRPIYTINEETPPDGAPAPLRREPSERPAPPRRRASPTKTHAIQAAPLPPRRPPSLAPPALPADLVGEVELADEPRARSHDEDTITEPERRSASPPAARPSRAPGGLVEMRSSKSFFPDPREEPESARGEALPHREPSPSWTNEDGPLSQGPYMHGASRPSYRSDVPPPTFPKAPLLPRFQPGAPSELAETLSLPPGLHGQAVQLDVLPRTVLDARVQFTHLSRELGREYRKHRKVELRADPSGIEAMQRHLYETYGDNAIHSPEQALDVRRHGALLSEILARSLGGEWVDIGPTELGYWAMIVPSPNRGRPGEKDAGATRVWPFARIIRFIAMGHKERDLVSYYLELEARARA